MIKEAINILINGEDLSYEMCKDVVDEIMSGEASDDLIASFLTAMTCKGETIDEITGAAEGMRAHELVLPKSNDALEIVGTGGDKSNSINISTIASIIVSSAGYKVAKHGNRAASSKSGTADCFEALGVKLDISPERSKEILDEIGLCFLFAQKYHGAMKYVGPVRKNLGIRTIFNILGPLANPASCSKQLLGVFSKELVEPMARVLYKLGINDAMVVYGEDGLDEISMSAPTYVCEQRNGKYETYTINPEDYGFTLCRKDDIVGGTPQENADYAKQILSGVKGPKADAVIINAGAAIHVADPSKSIAEGIEIAKKQIENGKAIEQLKKFVELTNKQ